MQWLSKSHSVRPAKGENSKIAIILKKMNRLVTALIEKHKKMWKIDLFAIQGTVAKWSVGTSG